MASHEVRVIGFMERPDDDFTSTPASTVGILEVKPPIHVGETFGAVVLGKYNQSVAITEVGSTAEATILYAMSGVYGADQQSREAHIGTIAERVKQFANNPASSIDLMQQDPFPSRREEW